MIRLLLVPHAETDWSVEQRYAGHADIPLNARGWGQAAALALELARERIDAVQSSDLRRARETAMTIAGMRGLAVQSDPRLRELHVGAWQGLTVEEIQRRQPETLAAWMADASNEGPPGGESLAELAGRVSEFFDSVRGESADKHLALVAHRGSLRVLICVALGLEPRLNWRFRLVPASISELELYEGQAVLTRLNDTHHLRGE